jgi:methyltransferase family protein
MQPDGARTDPPTLPRLADTPMQKERAEMLIRFLPRNSIGAEIGVFRGEFSATIIRAIEPRELHLVDPWDIAYGANYPNWGDYTEHGALTTARAFAETVSRTTSGRKTKVIVVKDFSAPWLATMPDGYFDWIYLDSTHTYDDTKQELALSARKVKPEGVICGHDFEIRRHELHHGVFRAVTEFVRKGEYELIWAGPQQQWALRRSEKPAPPEAANPPGSWLSRFKGLWSVTRG